MSGSCAGYSSSFYRALENDVWILLGCRCFACMTKGALGTFEFNPTEAKAATEVAIFLSRFRRALWGVVGASEGDVRHFFGGWFLDRLGLNPAGVWLFRHRAERRPELPPKLPLQLHPQLHPLHGFCIVFSCFRSCLSGDVRHWRWPFFIFLVGVRRRR